MEERILNCLAMLEWATTQDIADALGVNRTTALRWLHRLRRQGLVRSRTVGAPPTEREIWLLTSCGVWRLFPQEHIHPGWSDGHIHDPLSEEMETHSHPSYWNSEAGARELFTLLELKRQFYPLAINLFKGDGRLWHADQAEARLISFRWLRRNRILQAVGEYEGALRIFFHWVSLEMSDAMLLARWRRRFEGLITYANSDDDWVDLDLPPEPRVIRPSGNVILTEDSGAFSVVLRNLAPLSAGSSGPWLVTCSADASLQHRVGQVRPSMDDVWDPHVDLDVGEPENLCPARYEDEQHDQGGHHGE